MDQLEGKERENGGSEAKIFVVKDRSIKTITVLNPKSIVPDLEKKCY